MMKREPERAAEGRFSQRLLKRALLSAVAIGIMLALGACNTMQGLGKDVEKAGEAIQKSTR